MKKTAYAEEINSPLNPETHLFAAANTYGGFVSLFDETFSRDAVGKIYILKGGPGNGKSTLMKRYAENAQKNGFSPIFYHCSSDPKSLDGVFVPETGTAILDGTPPHVFEPVYPCVRDVYVNLAGVFDEKKLAESDTAIKLLCRRKSDCYKTAYRLLAAAKNIESEMYALSQKFVSRRKIKDTAVRFAGKYLKKSICAKNRGEVSQILTQAVSADGEIRFFSPENRAETLFFIKENKLAGRMFLSELAEIVRRSGTEAVFSLMPENLSEVSGIYMPAQKISVSFFDDDYCAKLDKLGKPYKTINASRFTDSEKYKLYRGKYRFAEKCLETLKSSACEELSAAGAYHAKLEKIYGGAADYSAAEEIGRSIIGI